MESSGTNDTKVNMTALIPAYQPEPVLLEVLEKLRRCGMRILVVDDGSGPEFQELFRQASAFGQILTHPENRGKGAALKTGLASLQQQYDPESLIVTVDADGQHRAEDALRVCRTAQRHPEALVLGSRKLQKEVPLRSRFGNAVTRTVWYWITGNRIYDTQTGLRAFSVRRIPEFLAVAGERYEYEMQVLLFCSEKKIPILEEEIETIYRDRNASSHFHTLRDSIRVCRVIVLFLMKRLVRRIPPFRNRKSG